MQVLSLWRWLSLRFGEEHFPGAEKAEELAQQMVSLMELGLEALSKRQVSTEHSHKSTYLALDALGSSRHFPRLLRTGGSKPAHWLAECPSTPFSVGQAGTG